MVDQQFCLRWNNHKSTLISVFDTLLENNVLVDCTLAAEGQYLKAHKVVLCACSPYLERILSQHTERHPILILKDVKYQELKCMMDYMYKGEVNISQEQLETFLKAAESLQIKGLTDSGSKDDYRVANHSKRQEQTRKPPSIQLVSSTSPVSTPYSHSSALNELNVRQTSTSNVDAPLDASPNSRDRSLSPVPRKRKRPRRPSQTDSEHFDSASETPVQIQSTPMINVPLANQILSTSTSSTINDGTDQSLTVADIARFTGVLSTENIKKEKIESQPDNLIVPKTEFIDDVNEDGVEDLTLEEDIENMDGGPGPSHSSENSNQGYGWSIAGERSTDEIFSSQDLANTAQDNQENDGDVENSCIKREPQEQRTMNSAASMDKVSLQLVTSNAVSSTAATGRLADFICNGSSSSSVGAQPLFISFCPSDARVDQAPQCVQDGANSSQTMTTALLKALDSSSLDGNSNIELFYLYNENEPSNFGTGRRPEQTQLNSLTIAAQPNVTVFKAEPVPVNLNELMNTSDDNTDLTTLTTGCYPYDASAMNGLQSSGTANGAGAAMQDGASEELLAPQVTKKRQRWCLKKPVNECYTCTECSKVYTFKGNLMRHYKFECGKEPQFQCSECNASFHYANYLSCHFKRRHVLTDRKQTVDGAVDATADGRDGRSAQPDRRELQREDDYYAASDGSANMAAGRNHQATDQ